MWLGLLFARGDIHRNDGAAMVVNCFTCIHPVELLLLPSVTVIFRYHVVI